MANITQADIEAAEEIGASMASYYEFGCSDRYQDAKMFAARHREAAIKQRDAEIVAWLREHAPQWGHEALADAIERGEVG